MTFFEFFELGSFPRTFLADYSSLQQNMLKHSLQVTQLLLLEGVNKEFFVVSIQNHVLEHEERSCHVAGRMFMRPVNCVELRPKVLLLIDGTRKTQKNLPSMRHCDSKKRL